METHLKRITDLKGSLVKMSKITSRGIDFDDDDAKSRRFFMSETPYLKLKTLILILKKIQVGADLKLCCVALH